MSKSNIAVKIYDNNTVSALFLINKPIAEFYCEQVLGFDFANDECTKQSVAMALSDFITEHQLKTETSIEKHLLIYTNKHLVSQAVDEALSPVKDSLN